MMSLLYKPAYFVGLICLTCIVLALIIVAATKHVIRHKPIGDVINGQLKTTFASPEADRFFVLIQSASKGQLNGTIRILVDNQEQYKANFRQNECRLGPTFTGMQQQPYILVPVGTERGAIPNAAWRKKECRMILQLDINNAAPLPVTIMWPE
jgi:hypothetical protein